MTARFILPSCVSGVGHPNKSHRKPLGGGRQQDFLISYKNTNPPVVDPGHSCSVTDGMGGPVDAGV
jgi:hypothetical protein